MCMIWLRDASVIIRWFNIRVIEFAVTLRHVFQHVFRHHLDCFCSSSQDSIRPNTLVNSEQARVGSTSKTCRPTFPFVTPPPARTVLEARRLFKPDATKEGVSRWPASRLKR